MTDGPIYRGPFCLALGFVLVVQELMDAAKVFSASICMDCDGIVAQLTPRVSMREIWLLDVVDAFVDGPSARRMSYDVASAAPLAGLLQPVLWAIGVVGAIEPAVFIATLVRLLCRRVSPFAHAMQNLDRCAAGSRFALPAELPVRLGGFLVQLGGSDPVALGEAAAIGVLITLEPATREMWTEATAAGFYHSPGWNQEYPRVQILPVEGRLGGLQVRMPPAHGTFKAAPKVKEEGEQLQLGME